MKFSAHWARATAEATDGSGKTVKFSCWRSSDASRQQAHESALAAARRALTKLISGEPLARYGYGSGPMREEVKQQFDGPDGRLAAVITQNAYGSLVLNTARVMFVDVDFPQTSPGDELQHFFRKWFDKRSRPPAELVEEQARAAVAEFVVANRPWSARLYRTHSGLRVLATHAPFDPASESTRVVFQSLSADPLYVRLCQAQECFRARLTPKPWRCGHTANRIAWPREDPDDERRFDAWNQRYLARQAGFSTCRFVDAVGDGQVHPEVQGIIDVHDRLTRTGEELPLA